jgi:hypothetical protein
VQLVGYTYDLDFTRNVNNNQSTWVCRDSTGAEARRGCPGETTDRKRAAPTPCAKATRHHAGGPGSGYLDLPADSHPRVEPSARYALIHVTTTPYVRVSGGPL